MISGSLSSCVLMYTVMMSLSIVLPFFLSNAQKLPTLHVGLLLSVGPFVSTLFSPIGAKAAVRFGNRPIMILGMIVLGVGSLSMVTLAPSSSILGFAIRIAIASAGFALFQAPNNAAVMISARPEQRGTISGLLNLARTLGQATGASLMGSIFNYFTMASGGKDISVNSASAAAITSGVHGAFIAATILVIIAIVIGMTTFHFNNHLKSIKQGS
ncbi:MFS transporter [Desulfosporosinus hippei]|uniref:Major Facilitator Superfamily protein n=1 Tax=Desulfosporosinus hippei DSM 8344 TaxID=1121419 RepID=A0A1G8FPD3_9FIRM|nr:MFS transporter [Desulfosporosinus hippei]SDH83985.1 Major Facilitator Superfamily protein [Desulfosporosinus hippei DSM 8344]